MWTIKEYNIIMVLKKILKQIHKNSAWGTTIVKPGMYQRGIRVFVSEFMLLEKD